MRTVLCAALGLSLLGASAANAGDVRAPVFTDQLHPLLHKVHSLHQAEHKLRRLGTTPLMSSERACPTASRRASAAFATTSTSTTTATSCKSTSLDAAATMATTTAIGRALVTVATTTSGELGHDHDD